MSYDTGCSCCEGACFDAAAEFAQTGAAVDIKTTQVRYASGESGTTAPSGPWTAAVPSVDQGNFLWTRTKVTYDDGKSTVSYSVAYMGMDGLNVLDITANSGLELTRDDNMLTLSGQDALDYAESLVTDPTLTDPGGYIGRRVEGGGIIFFDYANGFNGSVSVEPITSDLNTYHVDQATGMVVKDTTDGTNRFYVVQDHDLITVKDGDQLMWSNGTSGTLYTLLGTDTAFGTGLANTELCYAAANTDGVLEWSTDAYACIWHYIGKGDYQSRDPKWFVPSKDELLVLLDMQWQTASKRKSYDKTVKLKQLPINLPPFLWSSSESSANAAYYANCSRGNMSSDSKGDSRYSRVRLVRTF